MKTILVPTDLSPSATNSTDYAAHLCKELGAKLILLHVYMIPTADSEIPYVMVPAEELQQASEIGIKKEAERIKSLVDMDVEWIVQLGLPSDEISYIAKEKNIDLVVLGMKDGGELDKLVGSTTIAVIRKCRQPVLVIHEQTQYAPFLSIAYATDFSYTADASQFEPLKFLVRQFNAKLMVVNIRKQGKTGIANDDTAKENLNQVFNEINPTYQIVEDDDIDHGLIRFLKEENPGLLTMVAHKHNLMERLFGAHHTRSMIYHTHIPMLILHDSN